MITAVDIGGSVVNEQQKDVGTSDPKAVPSKRADWQQPQWRMLDAREAETGGAGAVDFLNNS